MSAIRRPFASFMVIAILVAASCSHADTPRPSRSAVAPERGSETDTEAGEEGRVPEGPGEEGEDEVAEIQERIEAFEEADAQGRAGRTGPVVRAPALGWAGARIVHPRRDDWEPAVAADPREPWVYVLVTRFGAPVCARCPASVIMLERSRDGGRHWTKARPVCRCEGTRFQADPIIEVVPGTGSVYALWLNGFNTVFSRSDDHGRTWSRPVSTKGRIAWNDKPAVTVGPNGKRVYVTWNGPVGGDPYVSRSLDGGETWTQHRVVRSDRYFFAYNGDIGPGGTVAFAQSSITYSGPAGQPAGPIEHHVIVSDDRGATWTNVVVDSVRIGVPCTSTGCTSDYYIGHSAVTVTDDGTIALVYDGAAKNRRFQRVWTRISTDGGTTWSDRVRLSDPGEQAGFPMVASAGDGDLRMWFMQTRGGDLDAWNVWYRTSADGAATWGAPIRLSDVTSGYPYVSPKGFAEPYGDYGEIAITDTGATFAVWGEGDSYRGPGGVWFNRQR